jgi:putative spermidine/putrescine transport system permease protein
VSENGQRAALGSYGLWLAAGAVFLFLIAPVVIVGVISLNESKVLRFPPQALSWRWYERFLGDPEWRRSVWVSLEVALLTTLLATTLGFLAALALVRGSFGGKTAIYGFLLTPMIVPNIITAIAFYMAFAKWGASGSIFGMALGHTVLALPLVVIILTASLQGLDIGYERAALNLGASEWYTMRRITLPLAAPGLASAALFSFLTSFDELLISLFLAGVQAQTLTVRIWNNLALEIEPTIAAVSTCLIGATVLALGANALLQRGSRA